MPETITRQQAVALIESHLPPDQQQRLDLLRQRNNDGTLTDSEQVELLTLVEQIENADAVRAQAIIGAGLTRFEPAQINKSIGCIQFELARRWLSRTAPRNSPHGQE